MDSPSDYYFFIDTDPEHTGGDEPLMWLAKKDFYHAEGHLDDQERGDNVELPDGFSNAMEAAWEFDMTPEEARQAMLDAGFTENVQLGQW